MKKINLSSFLLCILLLCSCKSDEPDFDEKRNNIIGTWKVTEVVHEIRADTIYKESSRTLEVTFHADGTGVQESLLGTPLDISWVYQYKPPIMVTKSDNPDFTNISNIQFYTVTKNTKDRQIWEYEVPSINGVIDVYRNTWKMDRI